MEAALQKRLEAKSIPVTESGCWIWLGGIRAKSRGYGCLGVGNTVMQAHRASWLAYRGPIPDGKHVLHRCDVRLCINPDHLFLGTNADNVADKVAKGRGADLRGTKNPRAKLTEADVMAIRQSKLTGPQLAKIYGIAKQNIYAAKHGKTWGHL